MFIFIHNMGNAFSLQCPSHSSNLVSENFSSQIPLQCVLKTLLCSTTKSHKILYNFIYSVLKTQVCTQFFLLVIETWGYMSFLRNTRCLNSAGASGHHLAHNPCSKMTQSNVHITLPDCILVSPRLEVPQALSYLFQCLTAAAGSPYVIAEHLHICSCILSFLKYVFSKAPSSFL